MKCCGCWCSSDKKKRKKEKDKKKDLTKGEPALKISAIEELKSKLGHRETDASVDSPEDLPPPPPLESDDDAASDCTGMIPETVRAANRPHPPPPPLITDEGLILPRKPTNPVRENPERQSLHRELLFNQKIGKNVLNQKSELQRALERHKENVARKQLEEHIASQTPELEKVIADRAKRLQSPHEKQDEDDKVINKEFLEARMKLKATSELK